MRHAATAVAALRRTRRRTAAPRRWRGTSPGASTSAIRAAISQRERCGVAARGGGEGRGEGATHSRLLCCFAQTQVAPQTSAAPGGSGHSNALPVRLQQSLQAKAAESITHSTRHIAHGRVRRHQWRGAGVARRSRRREARRAQTRGERSTRTRSEKRPRNRATTTTCDRRRRMRGASAHLTSSRTSRRRAA